MKNKDQLDLKQKIILYGVGFIGIILIVIGVGVYLMSEVEYNQKLDDPSLTPQLISDMKNNQINWLNIVSAQTVIATLDTFSVNNPFNIHLMVNVKNPDKIENITAMIVNSDFQLNDETIQMDIQKMKKYFGESNLETTVFRLDRIEDKKSFFGSKNDVIPTGGGFGSFIIAIYR